MTAPATTNPSHVPAASHSRVPADGAPARRSRRADLDATSGLCAQTDPELFFPTTGGSAAAPQRLCLRCPLLQACSAYLLNTLQRAPSLVEPGVWAATLPTDRRRLRTAPDPDAALAELHTARRAKLRVAPAGEGRILPPLPTAAHRRRALQHAHAGRAAA